MHASSPLIGFIGQGFVGKNYADDFESRGYSVVRYALEEPYRNNGEHIQDCDVVFVCVPTPTTPKGFDLSIVEGALKRVGAGKVAVIKSTILPGSTKKLQKKFPKITILFAPEFLRAAHAAEDVKAPFSHVIGMAADTPRHKEAAALVHSIMPSAPFSLTCMSDEAELFKYAHNVSGFTQIITFNLMYDMAKRLGANWDNVQEAVEHDPYISNRYARPVHQSGRGAGGACFIKDFAAFTKEYARSVGHKEAVAYMKAAEKFNIHLLRSTKKDLDLLAGVYGKGAVGPKKKRAAKKRPAKKVKKARTRKSR